MVSISVYSAAHFLAAAYTKLIYIKIVSTENTTPRRIFTPSASVKSISGFVIDEPELSCGVAFIGYGQNAYVADSTSETNVTLAMNTVVFSQATFNQNYTLYMAVDEQLALLY